MPGTGGRILSGGRKSHPDCAHAAMEIPLRFPSTQRQMQWGSLRTPRNTLCSTVDGGSVDRSRNFPFPKQTPPTSRHSLNDHRVEVQSVRGCNTRSCASDVHARVRENAGHEDFTAENHVVIGCTTPAPKTSRRECCRYPLQRDRATTEGRKTAEAWQSAHKIHLTRNTFHNEPVHTSTWTPRSGTLPSLSHRCWALQSNSWKIAFPSDEVRKRLIQQERLHGDSLMRSQHVSSSERIVGGHVAARDNFQCDTRYESSSPGATSQDEVPSVAKTLLHERIERDLQCLLQELLHSPTGRLDLQCVLHASVERGLLRGVCYSSTDVATVTADDPLLKGFWSVPCSGGYAEPLTNEVPSCQLLQQLWRQHLPQPHHTRAALPREGENQSAHVRAHNRTEPLHLCRMLCSNGELVHVPYTPYQQNISRASSPLAKGK